MLGKEQYIKRQLNINICKDTGLKLDNEHWYEFGRTKIGRNKVWRYGMNSCQQAELFLAINQTSQSVIEGKKGTCMFIDAAI